MSQHLIKEIDHLKRQILNLGTLVEEAVHKSVNTIAERSLDLCNEVIKGDQKINDREIEIEEECLKILALHQPVAIDLRYIVSVLKINNELERIGDLAVNIAQRVIQVLESNAPLPEVDFTPMSKKVSLMVKFSLDALVQYDASLAIKVFEIEEEVDQMHGEISAKARDQIRKDINILDTMSLFMVIAKHLERIADHAENIAEDVMYMIEGKIVRHKDMGVK